MARIAGVNIPTAKRVPIALTYITGIGHTSAKQICDAVGIQVVGRVIGTGVAGVTEPIGVGVGLVGVGDRGAVVDVGAVAIGVHVVRRVRRADVACVAGTVGVDVRLVRVRRGGAVVRVATDAIGVVVVRRILRAKDVPEIEVRIVEVLQPRSPYRIKGAGEIGLVPTAPAVACSWTSTTRS